MRRLSWFTSVTSGFALVAAVGCGSSGGSTTPMDSSTAPAAGQSLGNGAETSAGAFDTGFPGSNGGAIAHAAGGCESGSESWTQNGTTSLLVTFDNCVYTGFAGNETLNGTISVIDSEASGLVFTAKNNLTIALAGAGADAGLSAEIKLTGVQSGSFPQTGTVFTLTDATADSESITDGTQHYSLSDSKDWSDVYTPGVDWTPGTALVAGGLALSGKWSVNVNDQSADANLASSGLQIDPACGTRIVAGTLTATWSGSGGRSSALVVTWAGCGQRSVTYTGP
jgi:hypothetical protein